MRGILFWTWMVGGFLGATLSSACSQSVEDHSIYEANIMSGTQVPITSKKKGWQQAGPLATNDTTKFVTLQANFEDEPGNYTVQFGVPQPPSATGTTLGSYSCKADIFWSVEGQTIKRTVSVGNGVSVTGTGQGVKVRIYDDSGTVFGPGGDPYIVSAQVVKGTRPNVGKPPTIWNNWFQVAAGGVGTLAIPQDAGVISINVQVGELAASGIPPICNVLIKSLSGAILTQFDPNAVGAAFVPIPPGAAQVEFDNFSAADAYRVQVNFGIDG